MQSKATTVAQYLAALPAERRAALQAVRNVIRDNLDSDYAEGMQYGMIGYFVPHRVYPAGYHCDPRQPLPFAGLASQKQHMSLYIMGCYADPDSLAWLTQRWAASGKKLDMGKACIRFRTLDELPLDVIGEAIRRMPAATFIAHYERAMTTMKRRTAPRTGRVAPARGKTGTTTKARASAKPDASEKAGRRTAASVSRTKSTKSKPAPQPAAASKQRAAVRTKNGRS
jgi:hypothetical protein